MTEGIIQKAFNKFLNESCFTGFGTGEMDIRHLERELIEEIRKEFDNRKGIYHYELKLKLIGDSA
jgi:hypothetical protein